MSAAPLELRVVAMVKQNANTRVPKDEVADFIHITIQELRRRVAPTAFQHMAPRSMMSKERYGYRLIWSHAQNDFVGCLEFHLHTSKGLLQTSVSCLNCDGSLATDRERQILEVLDDCARRFKELQSEYSERITYVLFLELDYELAGTYNTDAGVIFPIKSQRSSAFRVGITTTVDEVSAERRMAVLHARAHDVAAALTLLTQNLFVPEYDYERLDKIDIPADAGSLFDDSAMFERDGQNSKIFDSSKIEREIIDEDNLHYGKKLLLPVTISKLLTAVLNRQDFLNCAKSFHTGLTMRRAINASGIRAAPILVGHELLSYVSAIEAVIKSQDKIVSCPSCGSDVNCGPGNIVRSYNEFVSDRSDGNPIFERAFSELYGLRSKFVHEGRNVYRMEQPIGALPIEMNKRGNFSPFPEHYFNIHEWTGFLLRRHVYWSLSCP